jgi:ABC-type Mn2+/Zn2+ transport system ATPase subunit
MDIAISQNASRHIIGSNGTGKSTLLANLILTDIREGLGVCLIEPHGDLAKTVIAGVPLKDVIYLDMNDSEYPFGLNLFQCDTRTI